MPKFKVTLEITLEGTDDLEAISDIANRIDKKIHEFAYVRKVEIKKIRTE